jgi:uncharacterized DUF497 family protein
MPQLAGIFDDSSHSAAEHREIIVGHSAAGKLLLECFTDLLENHIRIISSRRATKRKKNDFEEYITNQV